MTKLKQLGFTIIGLLIFSGCGSDFYVVNDLSFNVSFAKQQVQITYKIKPQYAFKYNQRFRFEQLGVVAVKWNEETKANELGALLNADPSILEKNWPSKEIVILPNKKKLPGSVKTKRILEWNQTGSALSGSLLYQKTPELIAGGAFIGGDFKDLPKGFFGTQKFREKNGSINATLSLAGPSENFEGGLFFFGNFGKNPFSKRSTEQAIASKNIPDLVKTLYADEPFEILNYGEDTKEKLTILREKFSSGCPALQCPSLSGFFSPQSESAL